MKMKSDMAAHDYGYMVPEMREPIVQDDGCTYSGFVFQSSECGKSWRLRWRRAHPNGMVTTGTLVMAGNPTNVVFRETGDLSCCVADS